MNPDRVQTFTASAGQAMRSAGHTTTEPLAAALAGSFGIFGALFSVNIIILGGILVFFMVLDLLAGALTAIRDPLEEFDRAKLYGGVIGKILLLLVPFVAAGMDVVIAIGAGDSALSELAATGLLSTTAIVLLIVAEAVSILQNVSRSYGGRVKAIAWLLRMIDSARWAQEHDEPVPARRKYDPLALEAEERMTEQAQDLEVKP